MYFLDSPTAMLSIKDGLELFKDFLKMKNIKFGVTIVVCWGLAVTSLIFSI
jgi:hypothetical protein